MQLIEVEVYFNLLQELIFIKNNYLFKHHLYNLRPLYEQHQAYLSI